MPENVEEEKKQEKNFYHELQEPAEIEKSVFVNEKKKKIKNSNSFLKQDIPEQLHRKLLNVKFKTKEF